MSSSAWRHIVSLSTFLGLLLSLSTGPYRLVVLLSNSASHWAVFGSTLCVAICCGLAFAIHGVLAEAIIYKHLGIKAAVAGLVGYAICLLAVQLQLSAAISVMGGAFLGMGLGITGVSQGMLLSRYNQTMALRLAAIAVIAACLIKAILLLINPLGLFIAFALLLLAPAMLPASIDARRQTGEASNRQKANEAAWGMVERNWVYFCGFALCLSVLSFNWLFVLSDHVDEFASNGISSLGTIAGILVASLTLLWFCRDDKEHRLQALMPYIPLLCIALIVITWIFGMWEQGFNLFGSFGSQTSLLIVSLPFGASTTLLATLLVVRLGKEVQCGLSSAFIFGIFSALSVGCFLLLTVLQALLSRDEAVALALVLRVIYLVAAALFMMAMSNKTRPRPGIQPDSMKEAFTQRFALTRRETDIVGYLLQGFSVPYIAQVECVSINTIKHHMKNIYGKTGVHKREDLLVLIYHATEK